MEVPEIGKISRIGDDDRVACLSDGRDERLRSDCAVAALGAADLSCNRSRVPKGIEAESIENVGESLALGMQWGELRVGAVAARDSVAKICDRPLSDEPGQRGRLV